MLDFESAQEKILSFIQSEIANKDIKLSLETRLDAVEIDSIDILNVLFKIEEEYGIEVQIPVEQNFETVGALINALIERIVV